MPSRPLRPCRHPGCPELVVNGYCDKHKKDTRQYDNRRGSAADRGYDSRWRKYRLLYLSQHPLCVECMKDNKLVSATVVDHIKPHKGDQCLFWDSDNHQPLCKQCHDRKTAREDGGFGHPGGR